jgi:MEMO1 family protein
MLASGWYPASGDDVRSVLRQWQAEEETINADAVSCVVPHAGWGFSGRLAFSTLRQLRAAVETVVVVGGHLPPSSALLVGKDDSFATPIGNLKADARVVRLLEGRLRFEKDRQSDNTVEIQLPMIKFLFPSASLVWLRAPPAQVATSLGTVLGEISLELGIGMAVVGSTDLTHYGPAYRYSPFGEGELAVQRVRDENDQTLLDHLLAMRPADAIAHARAKRSACSIGAAVAAISFAARLGVGEGHLVGHEMSCDTAASESFVGYGGVTYALGQ